MKKQAEIPTIELSKLIAPPFFKLHHDIKRGDHTHYVLKGGRGSCKSSFISVELILGLIKHPRTHAVVLRTVANTLHDSVFAQLLWAIEALGVSADWESSVSPMRIVNRRTRQTIYFRGADDPQKIRSMKPPFGYFRYIWYEEWNQFSGMEEIRNINQSLMRGGEKFDVFYSYNPPESINSWVNAEVQKTRPDRIVHHSDYLSINRAWLGEQFLIEAEHLKAVNPTAYAHEYLGEVTGTGGEVFRNVKLRAVTTEEIKCFEVVRRGLDFGYAIDPACYLVMAYERKYKRLTIFHEVYGTEISNRALANSIFEENKSNDPISADSAEPKSINELCQYGLRVTPVKKGPDSVEYGIKFLQDLEEIVIDDDRCPNTAKEFLNYELEKDAQGNFKNKFPDKNNHAIDATRYGMNLECMMFKDKKKQPKSKFPINSMEWKMEQHLKKLTDKRRRAEEWQ